MIRLRAILYCAVIVIFAGALCGCFPASDNHLDEENDPHYQRGRTLASSQDYKGAAEEFEKALETNPRNSAAHFELGCLYENQINDYAAAIYHYERHLALRPDSQRAQVTRDRIIGCKRELAKTEFPAPNSQNLQQEVDRLNAENLLLRQQLEAYRGQPAAAAPGPPPAPPPRLTAPPTPTPTLPPQPLAAAPMSTHSRVHIVKERETMSSIALQYGVKPSAILSANPNVDPRRLRIGQSLNLP